MGTEGAEQNGVFRVTIKKKEVVAAVLPMQEHWLSLSNLDLLLPPVDVGVFFCYRKPLIGDQSFGSMVTVLKKAMAQVLVSYYAFSGEIVGNSIGEPEIICNNRGVDFIEASADTELEQLNLYNPDQSIEGKLVPKKKNGVLAVQATELKCGGVVVGCTFDHRIADAYSANMFLVSWAETARSKAISMVPSFRRSLLHPRRLACLDPFLDNMYVPISKLQPTKEADHLISRIYYVKSDQLNQLQKLASSTDCKRTKLESFSAFLWQLIAKSTKRGQASGKAWVSKMGIVVDGRRRLNIDPLTTQMDAYFGNVLSIPYGGKRVDELTENSLSWVANEVHDFLESAVTKEHFLGLIDWVEAHRPEPGLAKIYSSGSDDGPAFVVSSGQRFPISKVDFGWGVPIFGSYHFPWGGSAGYVMPMPSPIGNGDWIVYMHLLKEQVELIEIEAAHFFRPVTCDYLNLVTT
ncbi:coniferyl alcohol acyltransferase [Ricinus communis]|uniref:Anthranilate N-benzoyltransferase protein, putative n=1 Tax=Ricinus communis TaxID=3988 RepID=B9S035_RICCO|nr:coniferyl alcohol acyltransferase [Ricinus communis]EEF43218.1 Anthranilate N-benzoyltransferase protein, putative [Ricinus communis]|eukprot:XP_002519354.1 shikimate O-hydroxycinnamoyltransferase [Ricinus communis]